MASKASPSYFGKPRSVISAELTPTEKVVCPLCQLAPQPFAVDYQGFQLVHCENCGLQFVSPRLSFEQLANKVYTETYFETPGDATAENEADNYQIARQLSNYERLLGRRGRVLDIGCGNGAFLQYAQKQGWEIFGTDIRLSNAARELSCPLWEGRLEEINFGNERFDVVRFNHVLEHTQNPLEELRLSRDLLRPNGIIHISVPNIAGLSPRLKSLQSRLRLKRHRWRHYAAMHHLFFWSPKTLRAFTEGAGLKLLLWETPVPRKAHQHGLTEKLYRLLLESSRSASILDFYCTLG
jgi:2-polyprenyl-3-methyl-5-hydroxy-6-metoxy-1,4-benzoquinol methylase